MSYSSKGFDLKKINYTTITHEGEIENDKQRILNKFNFFFGNSKGQLTSSVHIENNSRSRFYVRFIKCVLYINSSIY